MSVRISLRWCNEYCTKVVVESLKEAFGEDVEISITSGNVAVDLHNKDLHEHMDKGTFDISSKFIRKE